MAIDARLRVLTARRGADRLQPRRSHKAGNQLSRHGELRWPACGLCGDDGQRNDTLAIERLFRLAHAVIVWIGTVFADRSYYAEVNCAPCRRHGAEPRIYSAAPAWAGATDRESAPMRGCRETSAWACAMTGPASSW